MIEAELLDHGPEHLRGPQAGTFLPLVRQYCRVLAQCELLARYMGSIDLPQALTDTTTTSSRTSRTVSERTLSVAGAYDRALAKLVKLSDALLLSPSAQVRAGMTLKARALNLMEEAAALEGGGG
ncbi:MAG TPA: hypothetical protein VLW50_01610 [Streptosporangiaceae bacterium]|nr:hypothetical protein [Streptosporangiaceae bacterium]